MRSDGSVWAWGGNAAGQLGNGTTVATDRPVLITGATNVLNVSASDSTAADAHSLAVKNDGTVLAWGNNASGQLGDGTTTNRTTPVAVSGLTGVIAVSAGNGFSLALKSNGTVWAWGSNVNSRLGDGTTTTRLTPVAVTGLSTISAIDAGATHSLALKSDGSVWAWGLNSSGQIGDGTVVTRATAVKITTLTTMTAVSAGGSHSLALKSNGAVYAWGGNTTGAIGDGTTTNRTAPVLVSSLTGVASISAGYLHSVARKTDNTVRTWGYNLNGELGDGSSVNRLTSVAVPGVTAIAEVDAGAASTLVLDTSGNLFAWGSNVAGRLGTAGNRSRTTAEQVLGLATVTSVRSGPTHALAVKSNGTLWAWGANQAGQLGNGGTRHYQSVPVQTSVLTSVSNASAGKNHSLAVKTDGTAWSWGENTLGQLGTGNTTPRTTPGAVTGLTGVKSVSAGYTHSVALLNSGLVRAWGQNTSGQVGDGTVTNRTSSVAVSLLTAVTAVSAGDSYSLALKSNGTVWAWGLNASGQLGDGTTTNRSTPVQVSGITTAVAIATSGSSSYALLADGTVRAWGVNASGQLGDGTTTNRTSAVTVSGLTTVKAITAGTGHALAVKANGTAWAWGANASGQLGDGTTTNRTTAVQVLRSAGSTAGAAGNVVTFTLKQDGTLLAWGVGLLGELADGFSEAQPESWPVIGLNLSYTRAQISLTSPLTNSAVNLDQDVVVLPTVTPGDGAIQKVFYYSRGILLGESAASPYGFLYEPVTWGDREFNALSLDANGNYALSNSITLQTPYDSDLDGLADWKELSVVGSLADDGSDDTDGDGVTNADELTLGTDPFSWVDADLDGLPDNWETAHAGTFAVWPAVLNKTLLAQQTGPGTIILSNDTASAATFTATLSNNTRPVYGSKDSLTGGVTYAWDEISATGTLLPIVSNDDDNSEQVAFSSFTFPFYGTSYSDVYVSSNGLLTFGQPYSSGGNGPLPSTSSPLNAIAAFWDDLDTRTTGDIYYKQEATRFIVQFQDVGRYSAAGTYTFQVVLHASGRIELRYKTLGGIVNSATVGIQNPTGNRGIQVVSDAAYLVNNLEVAIDTPSEFYRLPVLTGSVPAHSTLNLAGVFRSYDISPGLHTANVSIAHTAGGTSPLGVTANLTIVNQPGTVIINSPSSGYSLLQGDTVDIQVYAIDPDGLDKVEIYDGATKVDERIANPGDENFSFYTPINTNGPRIITAKSVDIYGAVTSSTSILLNVTADNDFDGMPDAWEIANYLDPYDPYDGFVDADTDGYTNAEEYEFGTNPQIAEDTDFDGIPDGWEYHHGTDPNVADDFLDKDNDGLTNLQEYQYGTNPLTFDTDGDLLPDLYELQHYLDPLVPSGVDDVDSDGLTNFEEFENQTDPNNPDSDGDGATDGVEVDQGSDPNNPADGGLPPPDPIESVEFKVGGDYASWRMEIKSLGPRDTRTLLVVSPAPGTWETRSHQLWKNNKYEITMHHTGSRPQDNPPWYCWEGQIEGKPGVETFPYIGSYQLGSRNSAGMAFVIKNHWIVDNQEGLLTSHLHSVGSNHVGSRKAIMNPVELITPAGDPVNAAVDAGTGGTVPDGANEFTYSSAATGVLTMHLKAKAVGIGLLTPAERDLFLFDLDTITGSTFAWTSPANTGGKPTISGDDLTATATYTTLPTDNTAFGLKNARLKNDGVVSVEKKFEVFFPRDASNHAGGTAGTKNWYHYWLQLIPGHDVEYGGAGPGSAAEVKAMTTWSYTTARNKTRITIYDPATTKGRSYGVGEEFSGIDQFMGTLKHEAQHVVQIANADALLPTNGADSFRYGWSWNQGTHNHWKRGADAQWGVAATDDDSDGTLNNAKPLPPFEPGNGDDESLDHATYLWWPKTWPLPVPNAAPHPIESDALNVSDQTHDEHQSARSDWGNPGKNHLTIDKHDD